MANYTPNLSLYKPNRADSILVDTSLTNNFTIIDTEIKKLKDLKTSYGDSNSRPLLTADDVGFRYFDTTLKRPIWWTGSKWVYANGTEVVVINTYLTFNGGSDYLLMPSIQMDTIEVDMLLESTQPQQYPTLLDARAGLANGHINKTGGLNAGWSQLFINGVENTTKTWADIATSQRMTAKFIAASSFTDNVVFFTNYTYTGNTYSKGNLYKITCYSSGSIVAQYDMSKGSVLDQSGNGNHAILQGGTWMDTTTRDSEAVYSWVGGIE